MNYVNLIFNIICFNTQITKQIISLTHKLYTLKELSIYQHNRRNNRTNTSFKIYNILYNNTQNILPLTFRIITYKLPEISFILSAKKFLGFENKYPNRLGFKKFIFTQQKGIKNTHKNQIVSLKIYAYGY